ncbi:hypothetical protein H6770_04250 [Candidatus Peribacteria bacterium]|nr:hypothetical protein [Candidatus Peribacteria bacterium]
MRLVWTAAALTTIFGIVLWYKTPHDEVVYIITSDDRQAELRIPETAIPRGINVLDIAIEKTATGYRIVPEGIQLGNGTLFRNKLVTDTTP